MPKASTHPTLTPPQEDDGYDRLRLLRSRRVGPTTFHRLMAEHGSARGALAALPGIAAAAGVERYQICPEGVVHAELKAGRAAGAQLIHTTDPRYPGALRDLHDAPPMFWALGDLSVLSRPMISLVGARNASSLGTRMARRLAEELTEAGYVVVSGLARGVDAAAHAAALQGGTIAVVAGGVDVIYPAENTELAHDIVKTGLRLSEAPMGLQPQARHFPARNRIIAGLARAVVVVEAAAKSGSLITARAALDIGREVLAVPGHPIDARASGCNMLIRDGAVLIRSAADIVEAIGPTRDLATPEPDTGHSARPLKEVAALHDQILNRLGPSPLAEDQLVRDLGGPTQHLGPALVELELQGKITRQPGGLLSRAS